MRFDWKDALILPIGFVVLVVVLTLLQSVGIETSKGTKQALALAVFFGPIGLRRKLFRLPHLPPPKKGLFPSLGSVAGLLATFFGTALIVLGGYHLTKTRPAKPDFLSEERAIYAGVDGLDVSFEESAEERDARRERERREREEKIVSDAREREVRWQEDEAEFARRYFGILATGLALSCLGALGVWARYPRKGEVV